MRATAMETARGWVARPVQPICPKPRPGFALDGPIRRMSAAQSHGGRTVPVTGHPCLQRAGERADPPPACSLKLYKRHCLEGIQLYKGMHRFLPTLVKLRGYTVREEPVKHSPRHAGTAKYGLRNRALRAFVDLMAVRWMKQRYLRYEVSEMPREKEMMNAE